MKILEKKFRGSVMCRVLSYPIAYAIVKLLSEKGPMKLDDLVCHVKRGKSTVCAHLSKLRLANVVRYEKEWRKTVYRIKYPNELKRFFRSCEALVERTTQRIKKDF